jgi:glycosyltransferase involved in cell wall biosynthesis
MKILHVISSAGFYGAERMIVSLCKAQRSAGDEATIGLFENEHLPNTELASAATESGIPVEMVGCKGRIDRQAIVKLRAIVQHGHYEVLHAHGYKGDIYAYFAARGTQARRVSTCHNWLDNTAATYVYGMLDRFALRHFDAVAAVSEEVAERLRSAGVAKNKVHIVPNGIDVKEFAVEPESASARDRLRVGLVGRLSAEKGVGYFLEAAAKVSKEFPEVEFVVAGDGPELSNLQGRTRELGIAHSVRFAGKVLEMAAFYRGINVLVSSSVKEGLPMTLLEGMAARRAIVATNVGDVAKVIIDGHTGLLLQPGDVAGLADGILRLLRDGALREQLGRNGQSFVREKYSSESMREQYSEMYRAIVRAN